MKDTKLPPHLSELVSFVRATQWEQALLDEKELWQRLEMSRAAPDAQQEAISLLRSAGLNIVPGPGAATFYLSISMGHAFIRVTEKKLRAKVSSKKEPRSRNAFPALDLSASSFRAISIRQPYVEWILQGEKAEEYRTWQVSPGPILLHASRTVTAHEREGAEAEGTDLSVLPLGALVGVVNVVGIVGEAGDYAWQLENPRRFSHPVLYRGAAAIMRVPTEIIGKALQELQQS